MGQYFVLLPPLFATTIMPSADSSTAVNQHYLNKVMGLADEMDVAASEDIVDMRGMKLVAKGTRLTRSQQTTLGMHKLRKSLESTLVAEGAADASSIVAGATRILDTCAPLRAIIGVAGGGGPSPLGLLGTMRFGHAMRMMLTLTDRDGPTALDHSITVSLLSVCMAKKLRLPPEEQMVAGLAGLLHDIGELYIDPAYLKPARRLLPHEWSHLVVHPRIGQMLIAELESYPAAVGRAVAEHHERYDGTGYPRQLPGKDLSPCGQAVSVAEMIAGVLQKDHPLERAELALKVIPGEHSHALLSAISGALRAQGKPSGGEDFATAGSDDVATLQARILAAIEAGRSVGGAAPSTSQRARDLAGRTVERIMTIQRAFISTGLDYYLKQDNGLGDADSTMRFEKEVASRELSWRLRDIARELALNTACAPEETALFAPLITLLDDLPAPEAPMIGAPARSLGAAPMARVA